MIKKIKKKAFNYIDRKFNFKKIDYLEKKILHLSNVVMNSCLDDLIFSERDKLTIDGGIEAETKLEISKNDAMFHFWLYQCKSFKVAVNGYFSSGFKQAELIKLILAQYFDNNYKEKLLLDFASGHGRVTRHLLNFLDPKNVWISDIKSDAVEFQKKYFGFNTFLSTDNPETTKIELKYDFIFVSSLFTHLPEHLFRNWLIKLSNSLNEDGILILTTHENSYNNGLLYLEVSEENLFPELEGNLADKGTYGVTYIDDITFKKIMAEEKVNLHYLRFPKLWEGQDLYLLTKREFMLNLKKR